MSVRVMTSCIYGVLSCALLLTESVAAQSTFPSKVDDDGTLHVEGESSPFSDLASPQARRNYVDMTRGYESIDDPSRTSPLSIQEARERLDRLLMIPGVERLGRTFAVTITPGMIAGVQTDIIVPKSGVSPRNRNRVLINLHGGSMQVGARYGGQMESIPIASLGRIKVITVDYREAPER